MAEENGKATGRVNWETLFALEQAEAEARKAEALKYDADARKASAQAAHYQALERQLELDTRQKELQMEVLEVKRDQVLELRSEEKAQDKFHHLYIFSQNVELNSVSDCIYTLRTWDRLDPGCDIEILFNSPGGDITSGMMLFDYIRAVTLTHEVTTLTYGMAASMAGILLQAGQKRVMGQEAWILIHEAAFLAYGKTGEVEDRYEHIKRIQERIVDIFAKRSHMEQEYIRTNWKRRDWWIDSKEALELGLVDEVR